MKKLEKIDRITRDPRDGKALGFAFKPPERSGRVVFEVEDGELKIGDRTLLDDFELWLERGEHVSLIGPNGTRQDDADQGARRPSASSTPASCGAATTSRSGCSPSTPRSSGAPGARTVLEATQRATGLKPNEARALLGQFLFSGEAAEKPLDGLSGGERRRLSLAILVHSGANVLILDEPTNHLDLESREALEAALQAFPGSLLLISHDRALLDAVGTRTVAVEDRTLHSYVGGWPEYVRVREERADAERTGQARQAARRPSAEAEGRPARRRTSSAAPASWRRRSRPPRPTLRAIEEELADPTAWNDPRTAAQVDRAPQRGEEGARSALRGVGDGRRLSGEAADQRLERLPPERLPVRDPHPAPLDGGHPLAERMELQRGAVDRAPVQASCVRESLDLGLEHIQRLPGHGSHRLGHGYLPDSEREQRRVLAREAAEHQRRPRRGRRRRRR